MNSYDAPSMTPLSSGVSNNTTPKQLEPVLSEEEQLWVKFACSSLNSRNDALNAARVADQMIHSFKHRFR